MQKPGRTWYAWGMSRQFREFHHCADKEAASAAACEAVLTMLPTGPDSAQAFHVALSGGSSPDALYRLLGRELPANTHIWQVDERLVHHADPRSNWGLVQRTLLAEPTCAIPVDHLHPMPVRSPSEGADPAEYEVIVPARLHVAILGAGPDGHTASIFPGRALAEESERRVGLELQPGLDPQVARMTLTLPALNGCDCCIFLLGDKPHILDGLMNDTPASRAWPCAQVRAKKRTLVFSW